MVCLVQNLRRVVNVVCLVQNLGEWKEGWMDGRKEGWKDGRMEGWMEGKAGLRIAYSNQKEKFNRTSIYNLVKFCDLGTIVAFNTDL